MSSDRFLSRQRAALVLVLTISVAAGGPGLLTLRPCPAALDGRVYGVMALQLQVLHDHRGPWMGRTVLVRGLVTGYLSPPPQGVRPARGSMHLALLDPGQRRGLLGDLPLVRGPEHPVLQWLRRLPLLGPLMPSPQQLDWGEVALYHVTLHPVPDTSCDLCFIAELRDAA